MARETFTPYYVSIEGNLGSGKTSILRELARNTNAKVLEEPVEKWASIMKKYYSDPLRYAYEFQTIALLNFMVNDFDGFLVQERSLFSVFYIFTAALRATNYITTDQFEIMQKYVELVLKTSRPLNLIIYLKTTTSTSLQRIKHRGRSEESHLDYDHINMLNSLHGNIFSAQAGAFKIKVVTIDANRPFNKVYKSVLKALRKNVTNYWCDIREQNEMLELEYKDRDKGNFPYSRRYAHWVETKKALEDDQKEFHDLLVREKEENLKLIKQFEFEKMKDKEKPIQVKSEHDKTESSSTLDQDEYESLERIHKMILKVLDSKAKASSRDSDEEGEGSY